MNALTLTAPAAARPMPPRRHRPADTLPIADLLAAADLPPVGAEGDVAADENGHCDDGADDSSQSGDPATAAPSAFLILGRDEHDRPHASRFEGHNAEAVCHAAALMGMLVLPVSGDPLSMLAAKLPAGKLFASGKAFVPFVNGTLFEKLVSYTPIADRPKLVAGAGAARASAAKADKAQKADKPKADDGASAPAGDGAKGEAGAPALPPIEAAPSGELIPGKPIKPGAFPKDWDGIKLFSIVLATMESYDSWWPAEVTEVKDDGLFALKWVDGDSDLFLRRAEQLALLHPGFRGM